MKRFLIFLVTAASIIGVVGCSRNASRSGGEPGFQMKLCDNLRGTPQGSNRCEGTNRRLLHFFLTIGLLSVFLLPAVTSLPVSADAAVVWNTVTSTSGELNGVWGSSATDVFAVGYDGTILHYDGSAWSAMDSGTTHHLLCVWGSSLSSVFAVGSNGIILRYDGTMWSAMSSGTTSSLRGVWGSSASDVFAVGWDGTILHYDGSAWSSMTGGTSNHLWSVWGNSATDVFAVGGLGTILHYDGSAWSSMASSTTNDLLSIWGSSSSDVFALGAYGTILHYDGSAWSAMTSGTADALWGVWGSSPSNVFAVGHPGTILRYSKATTTEIASTVNPSVYGQPVTLTARVVPAIPASGTPTGTVTFREGSPILGKGTLSNGTATYSTSTLSAGNHAIMAFYSGDTDFAGSASSASTQTVSGATVNWGLIGGITIAAVVVVAALVYLLVVKRRPHRTERNRFRNRRVIAGVAAAIVVITIVSCVVAYQHGQHGSDGILFAIYGGGTTVQPYSMVQISIAHTCVFNDQLILETVEISGENAVSVKSLAVSKTLNSVFWKQRLLEALSILRLPVALIQGAYESFMRDAAELAEETRAQSFSTHYYTIDLRQIKQSLAVGDRIPIIVKATLFHNGERLTLERVVIAEYR